MPCPAPLRDRDAQSLRERSEWLRLRGLVAGEWPDLSEEHLKASLEAWLAPFLAGMTKRSQLARLDIARIIRSCFTHRQLVELDRLAPTHITVPTGSKIPLDYAAGEYPVLAVRLQEMRARSKSSDAALGLQGITVGDLIVYATGYGSMNGWAARLISQEVADRVGKCWGLGSDTTYDPGPWEGELRNMWKPTHQEALWFHGGNLHQSRHYSLYLALQLKARQVGLDTPVYGLQEVHHTS